MKDLNKPDLGLASKISLETLRLYLERAGWICYETSQDDAYAYARPDEERYLPAVIVPKKYGERTPQAIIDAALAICDFEDRDLAPVLNELLTFSCDHVQCRLVSSGVEDGSAPLSVVGDFIKNIAAILSAALKDVVKPEFVHKKLASSEITELLNVAKFGQTERGSFIVNIYVPLGQSKDSELFADARDNIFRKSLIHLMTALNQATACIDAGTPDEFLRKNSVSETKTSANLLEAVDKARIGDDSELVITVDWSTELPVDPNVPKRVSLKKEHSQSFWRWAAQYRPNEKQTSSNKFIAKVKGVAVEDRDDFGNPKGVATFRLAELDDELEGFEAQADLNVEDFRTALESLTKDQYCVFDGVCERSRNKAVISAVTNFNLIPLDAGGSFNISNPVLQ